MKGVVAVALTISSGYNGGFSEIDRCQNDKKRTMA